MNVNVALNRPSYLSSEYETGEYDHPASHGNDGDKSKCNGRQTPNSIAHSGISKPNPWYGVDLGMALKVDSVSLTNRADCCGIVNEHLSL